MTDVYAEELDESYYGTTFKFSVRNSAGYTIRIATVNSSEQLPNGHVRLRLSYPQMAIASEEITVPGDTMLHFVK